jgi:hypothetical protein
VVKGLIVIAERRTHKPANGRSLDTARHVRRDGRHVEAGRLRQD